MIIVSLELFDKVIGCLKTSVKIMVFLEIAVIVRTHLKLEIRIIVFLESAVTIKIHLQLVVMVKRYLLLSGMITWSLELVVMSMKCSENAVKITGFWALVVEHVVIIMASSDLHLVLAGRMASRHLHQSRN